MATPPSRGGAGGERRASRASNGNGSTPLEHIVLHVRNPMLPEALAAQHPDNYHVHFARSIQYVGSREIDKVNSSARLVSVMENMLVEESPRSCFGFVSTNFIDGMPVGFSCHIFDAEAQELAEQVVMATAQAFRAIQESGQSDSLSFASMNSLESRDSGMSKGSSRLSYPTASTVKPKPDAGALPRRPSSAHAHRRAHSDGNMAGTSVTAEGSERPAYISPTTVSAGYLVEQTGQNLYRRLHALSIPLIKEHRAPDGQRHALSFVASELVAWLVKEHDFPNHHDAVAFLHALLQTGVLEALPGSAMTFSDSQQLYRFSADSSAAAAAAVLQAAGGHSRRTRLNSSRSRRAFDGSDESLLGDSGHPGSSSSVEAGGGSVSPRVHRNRNVSLHSSWNGEEIGFGGDDAEGSWEEHGAAGGSGFLGDAIVLAALQERDAAALRARLAALPAPPANRDLALLVLAAVQANAVECADALLADGAVDINGVLNASGDTVLHRAALLNDRRTVAFLLERGADVNRINAVGATPLALAVTREENHECAIRLLEHGARIRIVNRDGKRPIDYMPVLAETQRLLCAGVGDDLARARDPLNTLHMLNRLAANPETLSMLGTQLGREDVLTTLTEICAASSEATALVVGYLDSVASSGDARQNSEGLGHGFRARGGSRFEPDLLAILVAFVRLPGLVRQRALACLAAVVGSSPGEDDDQLPQLARFDLSPIADALVAPGEEDELVANAESLGHAALVLAYVTRLPRARAALAGEALMRRLVQRVLQLAPIPAACQPAPLGSGLANVVRLLGNLCCELQHERQFRNIGTVSAMRALLHNRDVEVRQLAARALIILGEQEAGGIDLFTPASDEFPNLNTEADALYHRSGPCGGSGSGSGSDRNRGGGAGSRDDVAADADPAAAGGGSATGSTPGDRSPRTRATSPASSGGSSASTIRRPLDPQGCPVAWTVLKGASLERAVQLLTEPAVDNLAGVPFVMYQTYWPARVAFRLLRHRFRNTAMHTAMEVLPPEHLVVVRLLKRWIRQALSDFASDATLLKELKQFLEQMQAVGGPYATAAADLLRQQVGGDGRGGDVGNDDGAAPGSGHLSYAHSAHERMYPAAKQAVLSGEVPLTTEMAVALAAAQTRIDDLARRASNPHAAQALLKHTMPPVKLRNIMPASFARGRDSKQLLAAIQLEYDKIKHRTDRDCKHLYLGIYHLVANNEHMYFNVKQVVVESKRGTPRRVPRIVGVTPLRLLVVDDKSNKLLFSHSLVELRTWRQVAVKDRSRASFKLQTASKTAQLHLSFLNEEMVLTADEMTLTSLSDTLMMRIKQHPRFKAQAKAGAKAGVEDAKGARPRTGSLDRATAPSATATTTAAGGGGGIEPAMGTLGAAGSSSSALPAITTTDYAAEDHCAGMLRGNTQPDWANLLNDDGQIDLALFAPAADNAPQPQPQAQVSSASAAATGRSPLGSGTGTPHSSPRTTPLAGTPLSSNFNSPRPSPPSTPGTMRRRSASMAVDRRAAGPLLGTGSSGSVAGTLASTATGSAAARTLKRVDVAAAEASGSGSGSNSGMSNTNSADGRRSEGWLPSGAVAPTRRRGTMAAGGGEGGAAAAGRRPVARAQRRPAFVCNCPPNPALASTLDLRSLSAYQLLEHPLELARQLTLVEHEIFKAITPRECLEKVRATTSSSSVSAAANDAALTAVARFIQRFNLVSAWVAGLVVSEPDLEKRAWVMTQLVRAAVRCRALNNFNGVMEITSALGTAAVRRLTDTWDALSPECRSTYDTLASFAHAEGNFRTYRTALDAVAPPAVPYFGMNLRDLTFLHHGNPDFVKHGLMNIYKARALSSLLQRMQQLQHGTYNILLVPEIQRFLLAIQGLDEDELFRRSQAVQPPAVPTTRRGSTASRTSYTVGAASLSPPPAGSAAAGGGGGAGGGGAETTAELSPAGGLRGSRMNRRSSSTNLGFLRMGPLKEGKTSG